VLVVVVSFAVGILIGRSLLAERLGHPATKIDAAAPAILSRGNAQSHTGGPVTTTTGVTGMPTGTSTAPLRIAGGGTRAVSSSGAATEQDKSAARTAVTAAGIEMVVTPNEGDTPLRVDLPEEAVVQSASLEVRGQRFLYVPGAAPQRNHKVRKERVVIGPLLSRVTPPPPEVPAGAQGGEQVVTVRATIDGDGHVSYVDPLNGPITLIPAVMTAVREWRFAPSSLNGEPLKTTVDLTLRFRPTP
jgi:Gram-negative bacterial TonB protein C-terminal